MNKTVHTPPGSSPYWRMTLRALFVGIWRLLTWDCRERRAYRRYLRGDELDPRD